VSDFLKKIDRRQKGNTACGLIVSIQFSTGGCDGRFEREEELEEPLVTSEPVDRDSHVAVIHDSFGERYVNVALMLEQAPTVSVLRVLGAMSLVLRGEVQYLVKGAQLGQGTTVKLGDMLHIVGKLDGGC